MKKLLALTGLAFLALTLIPAPAAHADPNTLINNTYSSVGGLLPAFPSTPEYINCDQVQGGACGFVLLAQFVVGKFRPILTIVGALVITILGVHMLIGQEDDRLEKTRVAMTALISGLVMLYIIDPFIAAFYGSQGDVLTSQSNIQASVDNIISPELGGLINWVLTIVASLAILIIVINAFKAVLKGGSDDGIASIRKTLISVAAGIILLVVRITIADKFIARAGTDVAPGPIAGVLGIVVSVVTFLLGFLALAAVAVVIYSGVMMLFSFGKEEPWQKTKALLGRSLLGFVVIFLSLTLVKFVIAPSIGS